MGAVMLGRRSVLAGLAAVLLASRARAIPPPAMAPLRRGLYIWKTPAADAGEILAIAKRWKISHVAWSLSEPPDVMADGFARLRDAGLAVAALMGDMAWLKRPQIPDRLTAALAVPGLITALHLDVEPQVKGGWKNQAADQLAPKWIQLMHSIRAGVRRAIPIAVDLHPNAPNSVVLAADRLNMTINCMSYHKDVNRAVERAYGQIGRVTAEGNPIPWRLAVGLQQDRQALAGNPLGFEQALELVEAELAIRFPDSYDGLMLHDYRRLKALTAS